MKDQKKKLLILYLLIGIPIIIVIANNFNPFLMFMIWGILICAIVSLVGTVIYLNKIKKKWYTIWFIIPICILGAVGFIWSGAILLCNIQNIIVYQEWSQWFFEVIMIKCMEFAVFVVIVYVLIFALKPKRKKHGR